MMKYLEGEEITNEELKAGIRKATINVEFYPVKRRTKTKIHSYGNIVTVGGASINTN